MTGEQDFRALVCVTSCRRLDFLRRQLPHYAAASVADPRLSLLVSIDGTESETVDFCSSWGIPTIYSDEREGVGLSKNRVLTCFPDFDYYFFIEDDVELVDASVFQKHIDLFHESGIHHFSLFEPRGTRKPISNSIIAGVEVVHCLYGAASFNFFTAEGLRRVGGWHPAFATYKRWGHTEHSYRFVTNGLAPAPFNVAVGTVGSFIWHVPPAVTRVIGVASDSDQIAAPERELMDQHLTALPIQTLSLVHYNGIPFGQAAALAGLLKEGCRYPLLTEREKRRAQSDFQFWQFEYGASRVKRAAGLLRATSSWPGNPALRHALKTAVRP
jgi:hypothetical protein